ncbi:uncharacterized protein LOC129220396 isoform X1 [Uloborus diversus]|uniref:uncharacterized protein LOC129220396 isoform X1 n=1 Tax=Uloborus diversus TaxID=327109 RepID=UPI00240A35BA|nr:uncharacterized protein LOC129220396 isoform X1 [Uloborus diversus]
MWLCGIKILFCFLGVLQLCCCQEYDFAAEISRQCLVPDPVGLLDCVENKVTLPYLTSWVDCTNSLGQNVRTSADIINYRCKSVWEGKGVIPEVFYIKDCVIEKTGLPAKNVSAEVLGAYKECEATPSVSKTPQMNTKTAPIQQQHIHSSGVEYTSIAQNPQAQSGLFSSTAENKPSVQPSTLTTQYGQRIKSSNPVIQPIAQVQSPITASAQNGQNIQQSYSRNQFVPQVQAQLQTFQQSQQQSPIPAFNPFIQVPMQIRQPYSQQYFMIYPQAPLPSQQTYQASQKTTAPSQFTSQQQAVPLQQSPIYNQNSGFHQHAQAPLPSQQTYQASQMPTLSPQFLSQQQIAPFQQSPMYNQNPGFYQYSFQIHHPQLRIN